VILRERQELQEKRVPIIIVANYSDTKESDRAVTSEEGKEMAISFECAFFEAGMI
jgi:hypothetical protein